MVIRMRSLLPALAALLLGVTSAQAQVDAFVQNQGPAIKIKVTSCVVSSVRTRRYAEIAQSPCPSFVTIQRDVSFRSD